MSTTKRPTEPQVNRRTLVGKKAYHEYFLTLLMFFRDTRPGEEATWEKLIGYEQEALAKVEARLAARKR